LKKGGWITHLSGRILKPSLHESFVEKFVESLVDIPVSHFRQQASDKEKKTQDTYGHTSSSTSGQLDLFGAFGKMSQDTPRWGYGESCPIWKKKVIDARSAYSVRKKLALHTRGNECLSLRGWATPQSTDGDRINQVRKPSELSDKAKKGGCRNLREDVQNWATPNTMDYMETRSAEGVEKIASGARKGRKRPSNLREQVDKKTCDIYKKHNGLQDQEKSNTSGKNQGSWVTPNAGDGQAGMNMGRNGTGRQQKSLGQDVSKSIGGFNPTMKLNPNWVEQLMGLSTGWTDLDSWGMELSPKQQN
jgi:hypothetical protein